MHIHRTTLSSASDAAVLLSLPSYFPLAIDGTVSIIMRSLVWLFALLIIDPATPCYTRVNL